jgi:outer membrane translocation and assembly module TamA
MLQQALQLGRSCFQRLVLASTLAALALGCASGPRQRTVSDVKLVETSQSEVDREEALSGLALAAPRTLFWVERERDVYDPNLVARDLERIERFYRAQGYYDVKVVAARIENVGKNQVEIEVHVTPGPRVLVRQVQSDPQALLALPFDVQVEYAKVRKPATGKPFTEAVLNRYENSLLEVLKEAGYAYAKVRVSAVVDLNARAADINVAMQPGKRARVGEIRIVGLKQIPESKVRAALNLERGATYSEHDQQDAQQALVAMQLFTRVEVTPDLSNPDAEDVPILVTLQEDQLRKLTLGGGTVLDSLKLQMHLSTGWEHKNFMGGARRLSLQATGGVDLYPMRLEDFKTLAQKPTNDFWVIDTSVTLEQPAIFNGRTKGSVQARYTRQPVLYALSDTADPKTERVIGYHTPSAQLLLERSFLSQRIVLQPSYNLQARVPFSYQNGLVPGMETVWVSYPRLFALLQLYQGDLSSDRSKRDYSMSFRNTLEVAGLKLGGTRVLGGSVSDLKIEPEWRGVAPILPKRHSPEQKAGDLTVAGRVKLGFLLAADYGKSLRTDQAAEGSVDTTSDQQKLLSRAFYSGGATSNRGYAQNAISPHGPIGFLSPTGINCFMNPDPRCIRPLGGFTQWEASIEVRYAGLFPLTFVAFADAADVTRDIGALGFKYPHLSVGPGVRYETAVGPIRLDLGIRVPGLQALGQTELPLSHGQERPVFFESCDTNGKCRGFPAAIHLAIGDAF